MLKKWNRVLAILLAFALVTTTFGSDIASTRAFAVGSEEELAQLENDDIQTADWEQIPQEETQPEDPVEEQPQEEQEVTDAQPEENAEVTDEANQESGAAGEDAAATETTETPDDATQSTSEDAATESSSEEAAVASSEEAATAATSEAVVEEKLVTVTYKASKGGNVSIPKEIVNINDKEAKFQGATATAWNDKYTFVDWTDENGNQVSADATFVPENLEADATFTANFVAVEDIAEKMPAIEANDVHTGGMIVSVNAEEGLFPAGTEVKIEAVDDGTAVELAEKSLGEGKVKEAKAVDITFIYEGSEIQPADAKYVHVTMTLEEAIEGENFTVLHEHDGQVKELERQEVTTQMQTVDGEQTTVATAASFDANQFSVFIFAGEDDPDNIQKKVVTYIFYTSPEMTDVFNTQPVKNGDTLMNPGVPEFGDNESFVKWQQIIDDKKEDISFDVVNSITKDTPLEIKVVPLVKKTYYITFYGEKGEIFHVESIEVTGEQQPDIDLSKVPDYIPEVDIQECIGWAASEEDAAAGKTVEGPTVNAADTPELWPVITTSYWVRFDKNGSGATFTGARRVKDGATLGTIKDYVTGDNAPKRTGYTFAGWATTNDSTEANVNWDLVIDETTVNANNEYQLYAVWTPDTETNYTVIFWTQNVSDAYDAEGNPDNNNQDGTYTWDYYEAARLTGTTNDGLTEAIVNAALAEKAASDASWSVSRMNGADITGFQYLKNDVDGKTISRFGDTVVNVYYTRKVVTLTFKHKENVPTHESGYKAYSNQSNHKNNPVAGNDYYDANGDTRE